MLTADRFVDSRTGCSYRFVQSETEYFRPHYHDYFELFLTLSGSIGHVVNGTAQTLPQGTLMLIRPQDCHDYLHPEDHPFSFVNLCFTEAVFREIAAFLGEGFPAELLLNAALPPMVTLDSHEWRRLEQRMAALCVLENDCIAQLKLRMRTLVLEILTRWFSSFRDEPRAEVPLWLERLNSEMQRDRNFTEGIVRMVALSGKTREHLSRCIRRYYGKSASEYINDLRLTYFANMLRNSNHPIVELCYESGFQNVGWAYTLFRKKYGMSPRQYREKP